MIVVALLFLFFGLLARRLERLNVTGPMVFMVGGLLAALLMPGRLIASEAVLHGVAEITLVLLLFGDAATISWSEFRHNLLPARLLLIGLPLTMVLGTVVGWWLFPPLELWGAALLGAILAPTDAALAQAMVTNQRVPERVRKTLIVESGLNDGIALPVVLITASCLALMGQGDLLPQLGDGLKQVLLAPPIGLVVGWGGGKAIMFAMKKSWTEPSFDHFAGPCLAVLAFGLAHLVGGNGFIAAFVAGLFFDTSSDLASERLRKFDQEEGEVLSFATFFLFGVLMVGPALEHLSWQVFLYVALSLTVVRIVPVLLSLTGSGLNLGQRLTIGWFGPRGLASILFGLLVVDRYELPQGERVLTVVTMTVLLSVLLHGVTAGPLARRFPDTDLDAQST